MDITADSNGLQLSTPAAYGVSIPNIETPSSLHSVATAFEANKGSKAEAYAYEISGVQVGSTQGGLGTDLYIRGFSTGGGFTLYSGRSFLNGEIDNINFQARDTATVERIEILKGHNSARYGIAAPGGSINYRTKQPTYNPLLNIETTVGSHDLARLTLDAGGQTSEHSAYRMVVAAQNANDMRKNVVDDRYTLAPSWRWDYSANSHVQLEAEYYQNNRPYQMDTVYTQGATVYDISYVGPNARANRRTHRYGLNWLHLINPSWQTTLKLRHYDVKREDVLDGFFFLANPTQLHNFYADYVSHSNQNSARAELIYNFGKNTKHTLVAGRDYLDFNDTIDADRSAFDFLIEVYDPQFPNTPPETAYRQDTATQTNHGTYITHTAKWNKAWRTVASIRHARYQLSRERNGEPRDFGFNDDTTSWTLGATHLLNEHYSYFASANRSVEANRGSDANGQPYPSKVAHQLEVGVKRHFPGRGWFTASFFNIVQENLVIQNPREPDEFIPNGDLRSRGFEFDGAMKIAPNWHISGQITYLDTKILKHEEDVEGNRFANAPTLSGRISVNKRFQRCSLGLDLLASSSRKGDTANSFTLPGWTRWDSQAHCKTMPKQSVRITVENLLDKRYASSTLGEDNVVQGDRRNWRLSYQWELL
jgi:iron complex outermembrane receptor protein